MGHRDVHILNGGLTKWLADGRKTDSDTVNEDEYKYSVNKDRLKQFEDMLSAQGTSEIIDVRPDNIFANGHIEQAKNILLKNFFNPENNLLK